MEERHPQYHVDVLLPLERRSGFRRRRVLGGVGVSRGEQLLRQVAAISDDARGGRAGPLRGADRRSLGAGGCPPANHPLHLRRPRDRRGGRQRGRRRDGGRAVVQPGPPLAPADGDGDARLAAGVVRRGPREPHHAHDFRGPRRSLRQGPGGLHNVRCPVALRGRVAAGLYADGRYGRRQAVAAPAGRGGKRLHGQGTFQRRRDRDDPPRRLPRYRRRGRRSAAERPIRWAPVQWVLGPIGSHADEDGNGRRGRE